MEGKESGKASVRLYEELFAEHQVIIQKIIAENSQRAMEAIATQIGTLQKKATEFDVQTQPDSNFREGGPRTDTDAIVSTEPLLPDSPKTPKKTLLNAPDCTSLFGKTKSMKQIWQDVKGAPRLSRPRKSSKWLRKTMMNDMRDETTPFKEQQPVAPQGVFADAEAMKQKLRRELAKPEYDVANYYKESGWCQMLARSTILGNITLCVIGFNAVWIAVDVDHNDASLLVDADPVFQVVDNLFCFYFMAEILIRFGAFEKKKNGLKDAWFVFDSFMAASMAIETWVVSLIVIMFSMRTGTDTGDASLLKIFRLFRLVRMARMIRILKALPELMVIIKGLAVATRAVSCTVLLMLLVIYVFAIFFRQVTDGTKLGNMYFKTVPITMRFLVLQGTMADVADVAVSIFDENFVYAMIFLFFILTVTITIMNMLVGVLVGVVSTVASVEQEQILVQFVKENLNSVLKTVQTLDTDSNGMISKEEFAEMLHAPEAIKAFNMMGVDVLGLVDLSDFIFENGKELQFSDFIEMTMQLRGSNQATVKDIVDLRKFMFGELKLLAAVGDSDLSIRPAHSMEDVIKSICPATLGKPISAAQLASAPGTADIEASSGNMRPVVQVVGEGNDPATIEEHPSPHDNKKTRKQRTFNKSKRSEGVALDGQSNGDRKQQTPRQSEKLPHNGL